jgi:hypothetical protein
MGNRNWNFQLKDRASGEAIVTAGGVAYVTAAGDPARLALKNKDGSTLANPLTPTRGFIEFFADETVESVDLFIMAPGGQFVVRKGIKSSGPNEIEVDTGSLRHVAVIPFAIADYAANTETKSGFKTGTDKLWLTDGVAVNVTTLDSGMTIDVGTDGAGSNDPDGFIDGISLTAAALVKATLTNGAVTKGVLLKVQDSANAGDAAPECFKDASDEDITITLSASTDTGEGYVYLPYQIAA